MSYAVCRMPVCRRNRTCELPCRSWMDNRDETCTTCDSCARSASCGHDMCAQSDSRCTVHTSHGAGLMLHAISQCSAARHSALVVNGPRRHGACEVVSGELTSLRWTSAARTAKTYVPDCICAAGDFDMSQWKLRCSHSAVRGVREPVTHTELGNWGGKDVSVVRCQLSVSSRRARWRPAHVKPM